MRAETAPMRHERELIDLANETDLCYSAGVARSQRNGDQYKALRAKNQQLHDKVLKRG